MYFWSTNNINNCKVFEVHYGDAQEFGELLEDFVLGEVGVALVGVGVAQAEDVLQ